MAVPPRPRVLYAACPLCGGTELRPLCSADCSGHALYHPLVPPLINWVECAGCGHVCTDGYLPDDVLAAVFARTQPNQEPGVAFEQLRGVSARIVGQVARYVTEGRWLDVGFGNGSLLFTAEEWGFEPQGLDLRPGSVGKLRQLGIPARCADVTTLDEPGAYNVLSFADVLEHMPFPREGLRAAHRLLQPGGVLFLSMPHYGCMAWRLLDAARANPYWAELEHYHNFSRARLQALLAEEGFTPLHYAVSERYRVCMEIIARRSADAGRG